MALGGPTGQHSGSLSMLLLVAVAIAPQEVLSGEAGGTLDLENPSGQTVALTPTAVGCGTESSPNYAEGSCKIVGNVAIEFMMFGKTAEEVDTFETESMHGAFLKVDEAVDDTGLEGDMCGDSGKKSAKRAGKWKVVELAPGAMKDTLDSIKSTVPGVFFGTLVVGSIVLIIGAVKTLSADSAVKAVGGSVAGIFVAFLAALLFSLFAAMSIKSQAVSIMEDKVAEAAKVGMCNHCSALCAVGDLVSSF